eukprot:scaffold168877_cov30-Tisochrysis_lutea.AAC.3
MATLRRRRRRSERDGTDGVKRGGDDGPNLSLSIFDTEHDFSPVCSQPIAARGSHSDKEQYRSPQ